MISSTSDDFPPVNWWWCEVSESEQWWMNEGENSIKAQRCIFHSTNKDNRNQNMLCIVFSLHPVTFLLMNTISKSVWLTCILSESPEHPISGFICSTITLQTETAGKTHAVRFFQRMKVESDAGATSSDHSVNYKSDSWKLNWKM